MTIEPITSLSNPHWLRMRRALWPDTPQQEHIAEMQSFLEAPDRFAQFLAVSDAGTAVGLAEASLRTDYVNGAYTCPVGYLEGLYVEPAARLKGVARALVAAVAAWAQRNACTELISDTQLENRASQATHIALGFAETERVVFYKLQLSADDVA